MKDDLFLGLSEEDVQDTQCHVNTCYANYRKRKEQLHLKQYSHSNSAKLFPNNESHVPCLQVTVQKDPRQLTIKCYMKKVALFVIILNKCIGDTRKLST